MKMVKVEVSCQKGDAKAQAGLLLFPRWDYACTLAIELTECNGGVDIRQSQTLRGILSVESVEKIKEIIFVLEE